jgi:hypothetical protein
LGLWKDEWDKEKNNGNYTIYNEINDLLIKLRDGVRKKIPEENFNLWKLDAVLGIFGEEDKNKIIENKEESETTKIRWWGDIDKPKKVYLLPYKYILTQILMLISKECLFI